jgi:hypothetical protein
MPIHINLLAEAQAAEEMRRHDPVKRATYISILLVIASLMWSGMLEINAVLARERFDGVQTAINTRDAAYQRVMSDKKKIETIQAKLASLQKLQASRFLQGSLLNALQHATVDDVQLNRLRMDQAYFLTEGTDPQTNGDRVIQGRPSTVRERVTLHLDARDFSPNPGDQVNKFREVIAKQAYFQAMLDKTNGVQLANPPSSPQTDGGKPYVTFTLDCHFLEVTR